jgi:excisionase family DNA binding protein
MSAPQNDEPLMSAKQVAKRLKVHPETVRRATRAKKLTSYKLSKTLTRYRWSDVQKWIDLGYIAGNN